MVHAATDAGREFGIPEYCNLVLLKIKNQEGFQNLKQKLIDQKIRHTIQIEPDLDNEETALATEVISGDMRNIFREYRLWDIEEKI